jgi:hypothetical protein
MKSFFIVIVALFIFQITSYSQESKELNPQQNIVNPIDIFDVLRQLFKKSDTAKPVASPQKNAKNISFLPIVGYGPANGFVIGGAVSVTKSLGDPATTKLSSALFNVSVTTKSQVLLNLRSDLFLKGNKWFIPGDVRFLFFAQPTYGLGMYGLHNKTEYFNVNGSNISRDILDQPMRFNYVRIYETAVKEVVKHWYAGAGVNFDFHFDIKDQALNLDPTDPYISSHYIYSKKYGFDTAKYNTNGLSIQFMHDSRDNTVNAYKGSFANVSFRYNLEWLGSSQISTMLHYEWRNYVGLSKKTPRNVLAFWSWGDFVTSGRVPYLALPSITWDTYNRSGRGYIQGRFRGDNMVYAEAEWRFPITKNGLLGGDVFLNGTTASSPITAQGLFSSVAPGYGAGIRIKMNKNDRTNICIDYGRGFGSSGIYFNIRETF